VGQHYQAELAKYYDVKSFRWAKLFVGAWLASACSIYMYEEIYLKILF